MVLLYHYTDRGGKDGIYQDKLIRATDCGDGLGKVVRFTELAHATDKATLIANNWGPVAPSNAQDKLRFWFKFDSASLPSGTLKVALDGKRNVWICPVDVQLGGYSRGTPAPLQSDSTRTILYHFTDRAGKDAIHKDGKIKAVRPHGGQGLGASMPVAVYFTEIIPTASKEDLLFNMYGTRDVAAHPDFLERTRFWFKFDAKDLPGVQKRQTRLGRNEWVCGQDVPINSSTIVSGQRR